MTNKKARDIVNTHIASLRWALQLQTWAFNMEYGHIEGEIPARCFPDVRYPCAKIELNPATSDSTDEVLEDLRHEMIHCMTATFDTYEKAVQPLLTEAEFCALHAIYNRAQEEACANIERMLDLGLGLTPRKLMARAKTHSKSHDKDVKIPQQPQPDAVEKVICRQWLSLP